MSTTLIDYFTNLVRLTGSSRSHVAGGSDPTQIDTYVGYFELSHGFETPEAGKHEGEVCTDGCGGTVEGDRCMCTDWAYPMPNRYEVTITIPCWVTELHIKARSGEEYSFMWDNSASWCRGDGALAEKMMDTFLSSADLSTREKFVAPPSDNDWCGEPDYDMQV